MYQAASHSCSSQTSSRHVTAVPVPCSLLFGWCVSNKWLVNQRSGPIRRTLQSGNRSLARVPHLRAARPSLCRSAGRDRWPSPSLLLLLQPLTRLQSPAIPEVYLPTLHSFSNPPCALPSPPPLLLLQSVLLSVSLSLFSSSSLSDVVASSAADSAAPESDAESITSHV